MSGVQIPPPLPKRYVEMKFLKFLIIIYVNLLILFVLVNLLEAYSHYNIYGSFKISKHNYKYEKYPIHHSEYYQLDLFKVYSNVPNSNKLNIYKVDKNGFILTSLNQNIELVKKNNIKRIIILGGSTAEGHGASGVEETFAYLLNSKLKNIKKNFEVINAGVGGYTSANQISYLIIDLLRYQPDYIITLDGFNDMWTQFESLQYADIDNLDEFFTSYNYNRHSFYYTWKEINNDILNIALKFNEPLEYKVILENLINKILQDLIPHTYELFYSNANKENVSNEDKKYKRSKVLNKIENIQKYLLSNKKNDACKEFSKQAAINYLRNLKIIRKISKDKGIKFFSFLQSINKDVNVVHFQDLCLNNFYDYVLNNNKDIIDLDIYFNNHTNKNKNLFADKVHFSNQGHELMSEILYDKIIQSLN